MTADRAVKGEVTRAEFRLVAAGPPEFAETAQFLQQGRGRAVAHNPLDGKPFERFAQFIDLAQFRNARLPQFIPGVRSTRHQFLFFQPDQRLAHRSSRNLIAFSQHLIGQPAAGYENAVPDVVPDRLAYQLRRASVFSCFHRILLLG
ncbi:hypothetical protein SDC9_199741 [bioreactor metagenome]|uniref:Uncharacterized protein n=1 Tax=bioreactor metagenome TaxID=1076179 RepID=A0A645ILE7_9ZZZZ